MEVELCRVVPPELALYHENVPPVGEADAVSVILPAPHSLVLAQTGVDGLQVMVTLAVPVLVPLLPVMV